MKNSAVSAELFQIALENKLTNLFQDLTTEELKAFIENVSSDDFGKEGEYGFFCTNCNDSRQFKTKEEKSLFEKFHKLSGCDWRVKLNDNNKKRRMSIVIHRSGKAASKFGNGFVQDIIDKRLERLNEKVKENSEVLDESKGNVPQEQQAQ